MSSYDLSAYLDVFEELRAEKRWSESTDIYRLVALTLSGLEPAGIGARLREVSETLRKRSGWTDPLRSTVRHTVSALILLNGLDPAEFHDQVKLVRKGFRQRRMQRGNFYETLGACLLVLHAAPEAPTSEALDRTKAFLKSWNKAHPILTGADDYPMAALHTNLGGEVEATSNRIEDIYKALRRAKFSPSNVTQLTSHLLAVSEDEPEACVARFLALRDAAKGHKLPVRSYGLSDVAILSLVPGETSTLAALAAELRDGLRAAPKRPSERIAGTVAMSLVVHEALRRLGSQSLEAVATLPALQAVLAAQQAAVMASSMAATTAATTA